MLQKSKQVLFLTMIMLFILVVFQSTEVVLAQSAGDVLIVEVGADPVGNDTNGQAEFFEIYNSSTNSIDLTNWTVSDNFSSITLPSLTLDPGKILVVVWNTATLGSGGFYGCTSVPLSFSPATWFASQLDNTSDRLILRDSSNIIIDAVSYGADVTAFNPAALDVFDNSGATLQRQNYNTNFIDNDLASDWVGSSGAGTPCDVGPTAVSLQTTDTASGTPLALVAALVGLLGVTAVSVTRRRLR